jgi:ubiquitin carboxyl-terminal hydrolase 1
LQSFASLSYLIPYIEAIRAKAEKYDVPTPVVDCLFETVTRSSALLYFLFSSLNILRIRSDLNTPLSYYSSLRPTKMIATLSAPAHPYYMQQQSQSQSRNRSLLFSSREHQDAQELFQLLSSLVKEEAVEVDREATAIGLRVGSPADRDATPSPFEPVWEVGKSVFEGLTANRRSCVECGYTEAVMHFPFNSIQLAMPNTV